MFGTKKPAEQQVTDDDAPAVVDPEASGGLPPIDQRPFMDAIWPVLACGAGLFSDGYINNVRFVALSLYLPVPMRPLWSDLVLAGQKLTIFIGYRLRDHRAQISIW